MTRKNISNYKLTSWSYLKLKFTVHFLKSPKQTGIVSISTFWETFSTFRDTDSLLESTLIVALTVDDSNLLFKNSTNFEYWRLDTSHSLPILKNAYCPLIFISGRLRYCSLYAKFFLDCFRAAKPSFGLPSATVKTICKSLQVHNAFGIQIWCNAKLLDN